MLRLLRYIKDIWYLVIIAVLLIGMECFLGLNLPNFMSRIAMIMRNPTGYYQTWTGLYPFFGIELITPTQDPITDTWIIGGIMLGYSLLAITCAFGASITVSHIGAHFGKAIRHAMFQKVTNFSIDQYSDFGTASLITRTTNDIEQCQQTLQMSLRMLVRAPITLAIAIVMILTKDPRVALVLAVSIPIAIVVMVILFSKGIPYFGKMQALFDKVTKVLRESLTGVRVIRAFGQEKKELDRFNDISWLTEKTVIRFARIMSFGSPVLNITFNLTYIAIYFMGYKLMEGQPMQAMADYSTILASAEYAMEVMSAFMMFAGLIIMIPRGTVCAKRIHAVLDTTPTIPEPEHPVNVTSHEGTVEFKNVTFTFPDGETPALTNISFKTTPGSTTAIIGSTGSGKSSVIRLIPRLFDVTEGEVLVDGVNVKDFSKKDLRSRIGFVPQQALLFKGTVRSNMLFGSPEADEERIKTALDVAQATHFLSKKENGIDAEVEQGGKNFSGGQKQRLCIARALVRKAEIYIFDDSFSALDFKTDTKLRAALKGYTKDASVIIVAQRVSTILDADNIVVLNAGEIVGQGKHADLLKSCDVYREIVYSQLDPSEIEKTMAMSKKLALEGGDE
ncbi:MAG: ABC transporter ATP-binding protein [Bacilli bacterium]|nr:ABC transporter ATP-binding protein [Bacilli bacterium]